MAANDIEQLVRARAEMNRIMAQEVLANETYVKKPLGTFTGIWKGFDDAGNGLVAYKGRQYIVTILATTYARLDQSVILTLTKDGNYANW